MKKNYKYSSDEFDINKVIKLHRDNLCELKSDFEKSNMELDDCIIKSEQLLKDLGYSLPKRQKIICKTGPESIIVRKWEDIVQEANDRYDQSITFDDIFTSDELRSNEEYLIKLRSQFNDIHKLDLVDWSIPILAGVLSSLLSIVLVGIPQKTSDGIQAGTLSNYVRNLFEKILPPEEMEKLANKKFVKVPFDAQDNRNTVIDVAGLSSYYHRLLALGHDPILAFIVGVLDVLNGTMTTIDKNGKIVIQVIAQYADRSESSLFSAIAKVVLHLASDVNTSMGLPVPLMGLFNLLQVGAIGDENQTIAEIVQGMYYEGYDFVHFCSLSIPVMIIEVIVRLSYGLKRKHEGYKHYIPVISSREKYPKLDTELFVAHTVATAINAGYVYISKNPLVINYPQWISFIKYSFTQLKWIIVQKPDMQYKYVKEQLDDEWGEVYSEINQTWNMITGNNVVIDLS